MSADAPLASVPSAGHGFERTPIPRAVGSIHLFISLKGRDTDKREPPSAGSLPRCPQQLGLGQTKARSPELNLPCSVGYRRPQRHLSRCAKPAPGSETEFQVRYRDAVTVHTARACSLCLRACQGLTAESRTWRGRAGTGLRLLLPALSLLISELLRGADLGLSPPASLSKGSWLWVGHSMSLIEVSGCFDSGGVAWPQVGVLFAATATGPVGNRYLAPAQKMSGTM